MAKSTKSKATEDKSSATVFTEQAQKDDPVDQAEKPSSPAKLEDFDALYLRSVTSEFADDLDKIRNASDFSDKSVPILIDALKQGSSMYSEDERRIAMGLDSK
ncbi:hypothetical protein MMC09_003779 [Bachmanniomyces sp. S44760]|nr:hypothetical protein [Bachmanniomyces sp. S44760]